MDVWEQLADALAAAFAQAWVIACTAGLVLAGLVAAVAVRLRRKGDQ